MPNIPSYLLVFWGISIAIGILSPFFITGDSLVFKGFLASWWLITGLSVLRSGGALLWKNTKLKGIWLFSTFLVSFFGYGILLFIWVEKKLPFESILGFFIAYFLSLSIFALTTQSRVFKPKPTI